MKVTKIEIGRQGNFILALILLYFIFFGYICNVFPKIDIASGAVMQIREELIFLYQVLFHPRSFFSFIILFAIVFIMASRESFFEYAIRNSLWLIPGIMILSWFWYWILFGFDISVIYIYFITIEGYLTILTLLCTNLLAAILASVIKEKRKELKKLYLK
ncbi:MAG: hypothetical protein ACFE9N_06255 [Promethearchaeota archaeon]